MEKGINKGELFMKIIADIEFGLISFTDYSVYDTSRPAKSKKRSKAFYDKVKKGFLNGDRKEAEKAVRELLKEAEPLTDKQKVTVKEFIDRHLPAFRKKQN